MNELNLRERILEYAAEIPGFDTAELGDCLDVVHAAQEVHRAGDNYLAKYGMSPMRFNVLEALFHHPRGCLTPAELADEVGLSRAAMTAALDGLERKDYVRRRQHPDDRRMIEIHLTNPGRQFMSGVLPSCYRDIARMLRYLTEDDRKALQQIYVKLLKGLQEVLEVDE